MPVIEEVDVFFNPDEFGTVAHINGKSVKGLFSYATMLVNDVETRKPVFTCAEADVRAIGHGNRVQIQQHTYQVSGMKGDGTGLMTLMLEQANDEDRRTL